MHEKKGQSWCCDGLPTFFPHEKKGHGRSVQLVARLGRRPISVINVETALIAYQESTDVFTSQYEHAPYLFTKVFKKYCGMCYGRRYISGEP
jgi:hypothetical protein